MEQVGTLYFFVFLFYLSCKCVHHTKWFLVQDGSESLQRTTFLKVYVHYSETLIRPWHVSVSDKKM